MKSLREKTLSRTTLNSSKAQSIEESDTPIPMSISDIIPLGGQRTQLELQGIKTWEKVCETLMEDMNKL